MKILVTGSSGFIGNYLAPKLNQLGHEVIGTYYKNQIKLPGIECVYLDLNNWEQTRLLLEEKKINIVFHLAGYIPKNVNIPEVEKTKKCVDINGLDTYYLLKCCHKMNIEKFIYSSTASVYDRYNISLPVKEEYASPKNIYGASKFLGENFCEIFRREKNMKTVSLRFSSVYGFGQESNSVLPVFIKKAIQNEDIEVWGRGIRTQDFIHVEDVVNALIKAAFSDVDGIFNIGSGKETSMYFLAELVKETFNPDGRIVLKSVESEDVSRFFLDVSKAKREMGYKVQYNLQSGLVQYKFKLDEHNENRLNF